MAEVDSSAEVLSRPNFLCPEILHPGQTGCKFSTLEERVANIEDIANGHTITLTEVKAYGKATVFWTKVIAWLVGTLISIAVLYFSTLEARKKTELIVPKTTGQVYSANNHLRQLAGSWGWPGVAAQVH